MKCGRRRLTNILSNPICGGEVIAFFIYLAVGRRLATS